MPQTAPAVRSWGVNADASLEAIFRDQYERMARAIGYVIHDQARAEELAVEVFLRWWKTKEAHGEQAVGWLYRTSVREALDELRRQTRRSRFERLFSFARTTPATPAHLYEVSVEQQNVRNVLGTLSRRHAEILLLRAQDLSYQEIATVLRLKPSYVGSLLIRAQDAFRKEYVKRYGTAE